MRITTTVSRAPTSTQVACRAISCIGIDVASMALPASALYTITTLTQTRKRAAPKSHLSDFSLRAMTLPL